MYTKLTVIIVFNYSGTSIIQTSQAHGLASSPASLPALEHKHSDKTTAAKIVIESRKEEKLEACITDSSQLTQTQTSVSQFQVADQQYSKLTCDLCRPS